MGAGLVGDGPGDTSVASPVALGAFLERADDLHALEQSLVAVRASGQGKLALVAGEAGVGKTALLRRFVSRRVGRCRCCGGV